MRTKRESAEEQVAAFLKKAGKKRYTARQVAEKVGYCDGYIKMFNCWKEYRKQFVVPTADERVREYLSGIGKSIPLVREVADACKCDMSTVRESDSWRTHKRQLKTLPKKTRIENFITGVWTDKYTAAQIAGQKSCKCSDGYVMLQGTWKEYQKRIKLLPAETRIRKVLAKDKTGKTRFTARQVAENAELHVSTVSNSEAWQEYRNRIRKADGEPRHEYRIHRKDLSPELEKRIGQYLSKNKGKKTRREVADAVGCCTLSVQNSKSWERYYKQFTTPDTDKIIRPFLFDAKGNLLLNENGEKIKRREVATAVGCDESTVTDSESWQEYQEHFATTPVNVRIRKFLIKDRTGKKGFTARQVAEAVECGVPTVLEKDEWKKYQEKVKALRPKGTANERIEKAYQELLAEGKQRITFKLLAERARCSKYTAHRSPTWKNRQRLSAVPVASAASPAGSLQPVIMARAKTEKESNPNGKTTFKTIVENNNKIANENAKRLMFQANYKAGLALKYADKVDEWHYISDTKYGGVGWMEIARSELKQQVKDGTIKSFKEKDVVNLSVRIGNAVKSHRETMGITGE